MFLAVNGSQIVKKNSSPQYYEFRHINYFVNELFLYLYLTVNGVSPGGSGTTIRHNTQITHIIQNNTTMKRNTVHKIHTQ
jgi:hypothetical protein